MPPRVFFLLMKYIGTIVIASNPIIEKITITNKSKFKAESDINNIIIKSSASPSLSYTVTTKIPKYPFLVESL